MQLKHDYLAAYRSLKLTRDSEGVLVADPELAHIGLHENDAKAKGIPSDPSKNRKAVCGQPLDCGQVAMLKVRPDPVSRSRQMNHVSLHMTLDSERQIHECLSSPDSYCVCGEGRL